MKNIGTLLYTMLILNVLLVSGCKSKLKAPSEQEDEQISITAFEDVPNWAKEAIWYQIYPDIFRNGDKGNDPKAENIVGYYPGPVPSNWEITDWGMDWYNLQEWNEEIRGMTDIEGYEIQHFGQFNQLRYYGGDIQGIIDKLDYLKNLGINGLYINPLYDAPSSHNFDARNWRHIDINFGPKPVDDLKIMAKETPDDPSTWQFTNADQLFLKLIEEVHKRDMKLIMDYSWNHVGLEFWAWKAVLKNQEQSKYKDWFWINTFDDPNTPENELDYPKWLESVKHLVQVKETEYVTHIPESHYWEGNLASESLKQHIFNIARRWLDPNGDGDPSDGIDGYRLDVYAEIPLGFWRDYRKVVREVNPNAYIVGEAWFKRFPHSMLDPEPTLRGDIADGVMNYRWYKTAREFFIHPDKGIAPTEFRDSLERITKNIRPQNLRAMMNTASTHDSPRLLSSVFNHQYPYKVNQNPNAENGYKVYKPDAQAYETAKLILVNQFTFLGAPHIWQGEELGMWGGDFPDCRKPMVWDDIQFEDEKTHPYGVERPVNKVEANKEVFGFYQNLIELRKNNPVLVYGDIAYIHADDQKKTFAYRRFNDTQEVIVVFNTSSTAQKIKLEAKYSGDVYDFFKNQTVQKNSKKIQLELPARSSAVLIQSHK
ncbi:MULTISPECIES: alpha-amylase family glycosyl hydrolase [Flavobacteriaceae]|uniref:alpha-amylase family glycosyl hydrolase n=1 Tax=Flavobacteriaceae TaxID=49546 RepID=UPI001490B7D5|nr:MULTISPECIES: alpha-amylase family glycosyl hydrolase [Allomuricauda]MDC6367315.1 alpha-amylase family glycosyl hydrolase [Muricauda sp. AC10]